jgi:hypothetical protein
MLRLSRLILLAALAGAIGLGAVVATHRPDVSVSAAAKRHHSGGGDNNPPTIQGHYWS